MLCFQAGLALFASVFCLAACQSGAQPERLYLQVNLQTNIASKQYPLRVLTGPQPSAELNAVKCFILLHCIFSTSVVIVYHWHVIDIYDMWHILYNISII